MNRNIRTLGLAPVAVFARSAIAASAAQATEAQFSWDAGTKHLLATSDPTDPSQAWTFTGGVLPFTCDTVTWTGDIPPGKTGSEEITAGKSFEIGAPGCLFKIGTQTGLGDSHIQNRQNRHQRGNYSRRENSQSNGTRDENTELQPL